MLNKSEKVSGQDIPNGTKKVIEGKPSIFFDGYWVRCYNIKSDDYASKKQLIDQLTKRVFHHAEPGINTPGFRLDQIRYLYEMETEPAQKRVKGAMLAGALMNRSSDILTSIVDLQEAGVKLESGNPLLKECGRCFLEALELGRNVKLSNGGEGLDELWGEPFKVFTMSMEKFYESRYIKIAQAMSEIDRITAALSGIVSGYSIIVDVIPKIIELGEGAKLACETIRTDPAIFDIWPRYVAAKEAMEEYISEFIKKHETDNGIPEKKVMNLVQEGTSLLISVATVRVPIPQSTEQFLEECQSFRT